MRITSDSLAAQSKQRGDSVSIKPKNLHLGISREMPRGSRPCERGQPALLNDGDLTAFQHPNQHSVCCNHKHSLFSKIRRRQSEHGLQLIRANGNAVREDTRLSPFPFIKHGLSFGNSRPAARIPLVEHTLQYCSTTTIISCSPLFLEDLQFGDGREKQENSNDNQAYFHGNLSNTTTRSPLTPAFTSNPFLDNKKARGSALKPWSLIAESDFSGGMVHLYSSARTHFITSLSPGGNGS